MPKILVVDDEPKILRIIEHCLSREGYEVSTAIDGQQALEQFQRQDYDLVVLDLALPKVDGFQVCRTIRETSSVPIIILSVRNQELDKILGFNLGVDDYLTKPFSPVELCLRVKAVLRRTKIEHKVVNNEGLIYCHNGLSINPSSREVLLDDQPIELTAKEFDILWFMVKHPNKVFTRKQLLYQIWQNDYIGNEDTVTVLISRLREKIKRDDSPISFIQTLRGVGYKFALYE
ncbi:response regulator transcription factor [Sporomusa sp.]|uniref:response regulator transcription factor n=1 Tax=Sporomusa sp. TaxID=2078658 RepID=UPI00297548BA|nr:response regulator transcription factor [Sporomusa sp.]MDF2570406.1 response regulator with CheY-like receiver domain and winged-helix DNA-binding domain [Sporomusa sp.]HWR06126.1 response regulator transcription factor [Sporomusa sp.]